MTGAGERQKGVLLRVAKVGADFAAEKLDRHERRPVSPTIKVEGVGVATGVSFWSTSRSSSTSPSTNASFTFAVGDGESLAATFALWAIRRTQRRLRRQWQAVRRSS